MTVTTRLMSKPISTSSPQSPSVSKNVHSNEKTLSPKKSSTKRTFTRFLRLRRHDNINKSTSSFSTAVTSIADSEDNPANDQNEVMSDNGVNILNELSILSIHDDGFEIQWQQEGDDSTTESEKYLAQEATLLQDVLPRAKSLYQNGRHYAERGHYNDALHFHCSALDMLRSHSSTHHNRGNLKSYFDDDYSTILSQYDIASKQLPVVDTQVSLEISRVQYEISKTEFAMLQEQPHTDMKVLADARMQLYHHALQYYKEELSMLRRKCLLHEDDMTFRMNLSRLLHVVARLYDEKLNDYDVALGYYREALQVEEALLDEHTDISSPLYQELLERVQDTRTTIGSIYYKQGDFQRAMKSATLCSETVLCSC